LRVCATAKAPGLLPAPLWSGILMLCAARCAAGDRRGQSGQAADRRRDEITAVFDSVGRDRIGLVVRS
jgi:hypothetical protein